MPAKLYCETPDFIGRKRFAFFLLFCTKAREMYKMQQPSEKALHKGRNVIDWGQFFPHFIRKYLPFSSILSLLKVFVVFSKIYFFVLLLYLQFILKMLSLSLLFFFLCYLNPHWPTACARVALSLELLNEKLQKFPALKSDLDRNHLNVWVTVALDTIQASWMWRSTGIWVSLWVLFIFYLPIWVLKMLSF